MHFFRIWLKFVISALIFRTLCPTASIGPIIKCPNCRVDNITHGPNFKLINSQFLILASIELQHTANTSIHIFIISFRELLVILSTPIPPYLIATIMQIYRQIYLIFSKQFINNSSRWTFITFCVLIDRIITV